MAVIQPIFLLLMKTGFFVMALNMAVMSEAVAVAVRCTRVSPAIEAALVTAFRPSLSSASTGCRYTIFIQDLLGGVGTDVEVPRHGEDVSHGAIGRDDILSEVGIVAFLRRECHICLIFIDELLELFDRLGVFLGLDVGVSLLDSLVDIHRHVEHPFGYFLYEEVIAAYDEIHTTGSLEEPLPYFLVW